MMILNKEKSRKVRELVDVSPGKIFIELLRQHVRDCLDTIDHLRVRVEEVEGAYQELLTESGFEDGWTGTYYLTCGAVKEPGAVFKEGTCDMCKEFAKTGEPTGACSCKY